MQVVNIPVERVNILSQAREDLEKYGKIKLIIDPDGTITIESDDEVNSWKVYDVVRAIGRGFNPGIARNLLHEDFMLVIIDLKAMFGKEKERDRMKARVIGTKGKAKKSIEEISGAYLCIYEHTVGIVGRIDEVTAAERAVLALLAGFAHGTAYHILHSEKLKADSKKPQG